MKRNPSVDGLLSEFTAHPDRIELIAAMDLLMTTNNQLDEASAVFGQIESIAPGSIITYASLQQEAIAAAGPEGIEQLRKQKAAEPNNYQNNDPKPVFPDIHFHLISLIPIRLRAKEYK